MGHERKIEMWLCVWCVCVWLRVVCDDSWCALFLATITTNLGDIVQDGGMHMVGIVVESDDNDLFAASFGEKSIADIDNSTDTVVTVPSYNARSEAKWNNTNTRAEHILPRPENGLIGKLGIWFW